MSVLGVGRTLGQRSESIRRQKPQPRVLTPEGCMMHRIVRSYRPRTANWVLNLPDKGTRIGPALHWTGQDKLSGVAAPRKHGALTKPITYHCNGFSIRE